MTDQSNPSSPARAGIDLRDLTGAVLVMALSIACLVMTMPMRGGAELFPRAICTIMLICGALLFVRSIVRPGPAAESMPKGALGRITLAVVTTLAYIACIVPLGFVTTSLIYIPLAAYSQGLRSHVMIWVTTLVFLTGLYVLFQRVFHTPLPTELIVTLFQAR